MVWHSCSLHPTTPKITLAAGREDVPMMPSSGCSPIPRPTLGSTWGCGDSGHSSTREHPSQVHKNLSQNAKISNFFFLKKSKDTADTIVIFPLNSGWCCSGLLLNSYSAECSLVVLPFISICLKKISFVKVSFKMSIASSRCLEQQLFQVHI